MRFCVIAFALLIPSISVAGIDSPGYLGMRVRAVPEGGRVIEVYAQSKAEEAGIQEGDTIVSADGVDLAGHQVKQIIGHLKGDIGSTVELGVVRFPGTGEAETINIERGPRPPAIEGGKKPGFLSNIDRQVNLLVGQLRSNQVPNIKAAAAMWSESSDRKAVDLAVVRCLQQADDLPFSRSVDIFPETRRGFWEAVAQDWHSLLLSLGSNAQMDAAVYLVRHQATAELASEMIGAYLASQAGGHQDYAQQLATLAREVVAGDIDRVVATNVQSRDVIGENWSASVGAWVSDRAAVQLAVDQGPPEMAKTRLPEQVVERLEGSGLKMPWPIPEEHANGFGEIAPPKAKDFVLTTPDNQTLELAKHDGPVVLSFWATWCGPCRKEMPKLDELRAELAATGLDVWGLSVDEDKDAVAPFVAEQGWNVPVAFADSSTIASFDVGPIPRLFVLDREHRIVMDHTGFSEEGFDEIAEKIRGLAHGTEKLTRQLGTINYGEEIARVVGVGPAEHKPQSFAADHQGKVWMGLGNRIVPITLIDGLIDHDEDASIPSAIVPSILFWVDLDGDGTDEFVAAPENGNVIRASRRDGSVVWTQRGLDQIASAVPLLGEKTRLAVLRIQKEERPHPMGPLPDGSERPKVFADIARIELLDAKGAVVHVLPIEASVMEMASLGDRIAVVLSDRNTLVVDSRGQSETLAPAWQYLRGAGGQMVVGDQTSSEAGVLVAANSVRDVWEGRFGLEATLGRIAMTGGGDLVGIDDTGQTQFLIDLQRRPTNIEVGDLDGDGRDELVLFAHWFGFAALQIDAKGTNISQHESLATPSSEKSDEAQQGAKKKRARRQRTK